MLSEIRIENLAVISRAELVLSPGLNVITGETGAGKTILAHAISLLLGTRADSGLIRPGADEASVEAIFTCPEGFFADLSAKIDIPEDDELIVRRRVSRDGRSRAYLNGHATTLAVLEKVTGRLLAFSAQHEQRRLMMAARQLDILDDFCGAELSPLLEEYRLLFAQRSELNAQLAELSRGTEAEEREAELLGFQLAEIEAAGLLPGEDGQLEAERRRLLAAQELKEATAGLSAIVSGGEDTESLMDALAQTLSRLENTTGIDPALDELAAALAQNFYDLQELGSRARQYSESVADDPARLTEIEDRLDLLGQLKRKYGAGIDEINAYAAAAGEKLKSLTGEIEGRPLLEQELAAIESELLGLALRMRRLRRDGALRLEEEAGRHLRDLAFQDCGFTIRLAPNEGEEAQLTANSLTGSGAESAEFLVRLNPGMPAAMLKDTASGGELSRIMLAIKSAVSSSREAATLVFDEIDAGIGGETGGAVGAKLKGLSGGSQIICITHLPQIAAFADENFSVTKLADSKENTTITQVTRVREDEVIDELCRMMGSRPDDPQARAHAESLRAGAGQPGGPAAAAGPERRGKPAARPRAKRAKKARA